MNNEQPTEAPALDFDLAQSFLPAWAKESGPSDKLSKLTERFAHGDRPDRGGRGRGEERRPRPGHSQARGPGGGNNRRDERQGGGRGRREDRGSRDRRPERETRPEPVLEGWEARLLPDPRGTDGLAKQVRSTAKAYPLFELAMLVLDKPERYLVEFKRSTDTAPEVFQFTGDGSLWTNANEATKHVLATQLEQFYRRERVTVEPPKGNYNCVAVCGMSDVLLGPPNYHDYQEKVRRLHSERFSRMNFEDFKSRIRMLKDEESIQKWKDESSVKDEFYPLEVTEGTEPEKLANSAAVEQHYRDHYAEKSIVKIRNKVKVSGRVMAEAGSQPIRQLAKRLVSELSRFPLPLAHTLGQELASKGIQIFKAHENITYVSVARPKYLDRQASPVSEGLSAILDYLEANPKVPRAEQWKALVEMRPLSGEGAEAEREAEVRRDLSLLLHEGFAIDYARRGLEAVRRPKTRVNETKKSPNRASEKVSPPLEESQTIESDPELS